MNVKKLTIAQWTELQNQYDNTPGVNDGTGSGEHYKLTNLLNKLGYYPMTRQECMDMAGEILTNGYPD